jgi:hypothetical protein
MHSFSSRLSIPRFRVFDPPCCPFPNLARLMDPNGGSLAGAQQHTLRQRWEHPVQLDMGMERRKFDATI